jgi:hypothetical protein
MSQQNMLKELDHLDMLGLQPIVTHINQLKYAAIGSGLMFLNLQALYGMIPSSAETEFGVV